MELTDTERDTDVNSLELDKCLKSIGESPVKCPSKRSTAYIKEKVEKVSNSIKRRLLGSSEDISKVF